MTDPITITAIAGAIVAIVAAIANARKTNAETFQIKSNVNQVLARLDHEMSPNHGTSMKDSLNRIERMQTIMSHSLATLADSDIDIRREKIEDHARMWKTIQKLEEKLK